MRIPRETIDAIRERTDIVEVVGRHVTLKRRGSNHLGLCPFHQEKTPSFNVLQSKQIFHCFGCGEGGDVFKFVQKITGLSFVEVVKELATPAGVTIQERELSEDDIKRLKRRTSLYDACAEAAEYYHRTLMTQPEGAEARAYLERRGITVETQKRYALGYAPGGWTALLDHLHRRGISPQLALRAGLARHNERKNSHYDAFRERLIITIFDQRDRPIAFGGRIMAGDGPKYINSPETEIYKKSHTLYNLNRARAAIQREDRAVVVEGYFDVLSLVQAGFPETIATCGTALTKEHTRLLRRLTGRAIALFDGDEAGQRAADKSLPLFLEAGIDARRLTLPDGQDPDDFVQSEGAEAFVERLAQAQPLLDEALYRLLKRYGVSAGGKQRAVAEAIPLLQQVPDELRAHVIAGAAGILGVNEAVLRQRVGRVERTPSLPSGSGGARWVGDVQLNRLLYLLIHHHAEVSERIAAADPELVTEREDVRWVIGQLLTGEPLPAILDQVDGDVQRVLRTLSVHREGFSTDDKAPESANQILSWMELRSVKAEIQAVDQQLSACGPTADRAQFRALLGNKKELQRQLNELRRVVGSLPT